MTFQLLNKMNFNYTMSVKSDKPKSFFKEGLHLQPMDENGVIIASGFFNKKKPFLISTLI